MLQHTVVAVDLAKNVFEIAISKSPGKVCARNRLSRKGFALFLRDLKPATVVLEACGSSHHWGRMAHRAGHRVVLLPPHTVRPYVPRNKTDRTDAKGMLEAYRNEEIHAVPVKSVDQQALCALHRLRSGWQAQHTAQVNCVRGLLREFGLTIPCGAHHVVRHVHKFLSEPDSAIPFLLHQALLEACEEIEQLKKRIEAVNRTLMAFVKENEIACRLMKIPGIGYLTATALVAFVGNVRRFRSGRSFANFLGLTPRETSTAFQRSLGRISKQGDVYLRTLLIHGARSILAWARREKNLDRLRVWALQVEAKRGFNKAVVAIANKMARFVWVTWRHDRAFVPFESVQSVA